MTGSPQPHLEAELERTAGVRFDDHSARLTNPNEDELANAIALVAEDWAGEGGERASLGDLVAETRQVLDHDDLRRLVAAGLMRADTADAYARVLDADADAFTPELEELAAGVEERNRWSAPGWAAAHRELISRNPAELRSLAAEQGRTIDEAAYYVHLKTETGGDDTVFVVADSPTAAEVLALNWNPTAVAAIGAYPADLEAQGIEPPTRDGMADPGDYYADGGFGGPADEAGPVDVGAVLADDRAIDEAAARCEAARNDERADLAVAVAAAAVAAAEAGERARERAAAAGESARSAGERAASDADEWA